MMMMMSKQVRFIEFDWFILRFEFFIEPCIVFILIDATPTTNVGKTVEVVSPENDDDDDDDDDDGDDGDEQISKNQFIWS